jgi:hypothetical protein
MAGIRQMAPFMFVTFPWFHFTEKSFHHQIILTERLLTEKSVGRTPFGRTLFD